MPWTDVPSNSVAWADRGRPVVSQTVWDGGATTWDGGDTLWDAVRANTWADTSSPSNEWTNV